MRQKIIALWKQKILHEQTPENYHQHKQGENAHERLRGQGAWSQHLESLFSIKICFLFC
jgi:hypothetical protein